MEIRINLLHSETNNFKFRVIKLFSKVNRRFWIFQFIIFHSDFSPTAVSELKYQRQPLENELNLFFADESFACDDDKVEQSGITKMKLEHF